MHEANLSKSVETKMGQKEGKMDEQTEGQHLMTPLPTAGSQKLEQNIIYVK